MKSKLENAETCENDEMRSQIEERLCNLEEKKMLADVQEEQGQDVICFDDITGKELPWHAVRNVS